MTDPFIDTNQLEWLESERREDRSNFRVRIELVFRAYIYLGLLVAVIALGVFAFSFLDVVLTFEQRLALLVSGAGVAVAGMSAGYLAYMRQRDELLRKRFRVIAMDMDVVREWTRFEKTGRHILAEKKVNYNSRSPRSIIEALEANRLVSSETAHELRLALDVRNRVVHEPDPVDPREVHTAIGFLAKANAELSQMTARSDNDGSQGSQRRALKLDENG